MLFTLRVWNVHKTQGKKHSVPNPRMKVGLIILTHSVSDFKNNYLDTEVFTLKYSDPTRNHVIFLRFKNLVKKVFSSRNLILVLFTHFYIHLNYYQLVNILIWIKYQGSKWVFGSFRNNWILKTYLQPPILTYKSKRTLS